MGEVVAAWQAAVVNLRFAWRPMIAIDLLYKLVATAVLVPAIGIALRGFLHLSGSAVHADQEILYFFLSPIGLTTGIVIVGAVITVGVLELGCLMVVGLAAQERYPVTVVGTLGFALGRLLPTLRVAMRVVLRVFLIVAPFLAIGALLLLWLLGEHDINYYLTFKPPRFLLVAALVVLLAVAMSALLLRQLVRWIYVVPLVLFENVNPRRAFALGEQRIQGHKGVLILTVLSWVAATLLASSIVLGAVRLLGVGISAGLIEGRVPLLLLALGGLLLFWVAANLVLHLLGVCFLALLMSHAYRNWGSPESRNLPEVLLEQVGGQTTWLARRPLLILLAAVAVVAIGIGAGLLAEMKTEQRVLVIAHRGAAGNAPENTLAAVKEALDRGADWVEVDVQESADGTVVVIHDSDLMKVAGVPTKIWDASYEELSSVDIGSWFDARFSAERLPTLWDVLQLVRDRGGLNIELKYYGHDEKLPERVVALVESAGMQSKVEVMSLKASAVREMRALRPEWSVGLLTARALGDLTTVDSDFLAVNAAIASTAFVKRAHAAGKRVYVWTVNDPASMGRMVSRGVDGLITDYPGMARQLLDERAKMGSVQRLFMDFALRIGIDPDVSDRAEDEAHRGGG